MDKTSILNIKSLKEQVYEQNLRTLCGVTSAMGISWMSSNVDTLAKVGKLYDPDGDDFVVRVMDHIEQNLPSTSIILDKWILAVSIALTDTDDLSLKKSLRQAMVDYGHALYEILARLEDAEAQARFCSSFISRLECAGHSDAVKEWSRRLIDLLQSQGKSHERAQAMFQQGKASFYAGEHEDAANILRQGALLAKQLGDDELSASCEQFLQYANFFLRT